jgi:GT2 family glycosyltransferase
LTVTDDSLPTYAVISPVRDEAAHFPRTASSLVAQTYRPLEWIVVDDGSIDETRKIAESYAGDNPWITVMASVSTHGRARGSSIVRAFDCGRSHLRARPEITVKLDGDLFLPSHYFAWVAAMFARDERAGIVGGIVMMYDGSRWRPESTRQVHGAIKAYRSECLDEIGGLRPAMGWDGIDEYAARSRGWNVHVLSELHVLHYKRRGSKQPWFRARWEEGRGNHYMGYTTAALLARAAYRMAAEEPPVLGGLALAAGFFTARLRGDPQVDDDGAVALLRREQGATLRGLLAGRRPTAATSTTDGGPAFWAPVSN